MESMPIGLVMIDDHPLVLGGLQQGLGANPEFDVVDACSTIAAGWQSVLSQRPDSGRAALCSRPWCRGCSRIAFEPSPQVNSGSQWTGSIY